MKRRTQPTVIPVVILGALLSNAQNYSVMNYEVKLHPNKAARVAFPFENPGYASLSLTPAPNTGYNKIVNSVIEFPSDDVLWHRVDVNASSHVYAIDAGKGPGYSGREHVIIKGELGNTAAGGGGEPPKNPWFRVTVPDVNINWEGQTDETIEDTYMQPCVFTSDKSHHQVVVLKLPRDDDSLVSPVVSLSWDSPAIRLVWEDTGDPFPNGAGINFRAGGVRSYRFRVEPLIPYPIAFEIRLEGVMDNMPNKTYKERIPMDKVKGFTFYPTLESITFNHNTGSSANDAINLRQDYGNDLPYGNPPCEWDENGKSLPVCYVANRSVTVKAKIGFQNYWGVITEATVKAKQIGKEASLGNITPATIPIAPNVSDDYMFSVEGQTPNAVRLARSNEWEWVITHANGIELKKPFPFCTSGVHRVYTILDEPKAPWDNTYGSQQNAWVTALDFAITNGAKGATTAPAALSAITGYLHTGHGVTYDSAGGGCASYASGVQGRGIMDLTGYISKTSGSTVNCYDQAAAVCSIGALLGINVKYGYMNPFGYLYKVNLIGVGACNNPFYDSLLVPLPSANRIPLLNPPSGLTDLIHPERSNFENHAFAVLGGNVYDACSGPALGKSKLQYVTDTVDVSTFNETYPPEWGGSIQAGDSSKINEYDLTGVK